jgi:hypothetical protein
MKPINKTNSFLALVMMLASSASAGFYFDTGMGYGYGFATEKWESSWGYWANDDEGKERYVPRIGFDMGAKVGGGSSKIGLFFVCEFSMVAPLMVPYSVEDAISYMVGPGIIFYPTQNIQLASSYGASSHAGIGGSGGYAYNFSVAYDFSNYDHGVLLGIKYYGANDEYDDYYEIRKMKSSMIGMFVKYVYKGKRASLADEKREQSQSVIRDFALKNFNEIAENNQSEGEEHLNSLILLMESEGIPKDEALLLIKKAIKKSNGKAEIFANELERLAK